MRQMIVISGQSISIGFLRLTGCQRDPRDRGVTLPIPDIYHMLNNILKYNWFHS